MFQTLYGILVINSTLGHIKGEIMFFGKTKKKNKPTTIEHPVLGTLIKKTDWYTKKSFIITLWDIDVIPKKENKTEKHILTGEFKMEPMQHDMRNALYITAYELLEDYDSMLQKAKEMQASSIVANQYSGI